MAINLALLAFLAQAALPPAFVLEVQARQAALSQSANGSSRQPAFEKLEAIIDSLQRAQTDASAAAGFSARPPSVFDELRKLSRDYVDTEAGLTARLLFAQLAILVGSPSEQAEAKLELEEMQREHPAVWQGVFCQVLLRTLDAYSAENASELEQRFLALRSALNRALSLTQSSSPPNSPEYRLFEEVAAHMYMGDMEAALLDGLAHINERLGKEREARDIYKFIVDKWKGTALAKNAQLSLDNLSSRQESGRRVIDSFPEFDLTKASRPAETQDDPEKDAYVFGVAASILALVAIIITLVMVKRRRKGLKEGE